MKYPEKLGTIWVLCHDLTISCLYMSQTSFCQPQLIFFSGCKSKIFTIGPFTSSIVSLPRVLCLCFFFSSHVFLNFNWLTICYPVFWALYGKIHCFLVFLFLYFQINFLFSNYVPFSASWCSITSNLLWFCNCHHFILHWLTTIIFFDREKFERSYNFVSDSINQIWKSLQ